MKLLDKLDNLVNKPKETGVTQSKIDQLERSAAEKGEPLSAEEIDAIMNPNNPKPRGLKVWFLP